MIHSRAFIKYKYKSLNLRVEFYEGNTPFLIWLPGFLSNIDSLKANAIRNFAKSKGLGYLSFDYSAHGESDGDLETERFGHWVSQTNEIIKKYINKKDYILIGSSMGGFIGIHHLLKLENPLRVKAAISIAPAFNMGDIIQERIYNTQSEKDLNEQGFFIPDTHYEMASYSISKNFLEELCSWSIDNNILDIKNPVHIFHGNKDEDVPIEYAFVFIHKLTESISYLNVIPDGDHRLSRTVDISQIVNTINFYL